MQGGSRGQAAEGGHCGASSAPRWPHGSRLPRPNTSSSRSARSPRMPFFRTASYLATNNNTKSLGSSVRNISAEKSDFISDSNFAKQPGRGCFAPSVSRARIVVVASIAPLEPRSRGRPTESNPNPRPVSQSRSHLCAPPGRGRSRRIHSVQLQKNRDTGEAESR